MTGRRLILHRAARAATCSGVVALAGVDSGQTRHARRRQVHLAAAGRAPLLSRRTSRPRLVGEALGVRLVGGHPRRRCRQQFSAQPEIELAHRHIEVAAPAHARPWRWRPYLRSTCCHATACDTRRPSDYSSFLSPPIPVSVDGCWLGSSERAPRAGSQLNASTPRLHRAGSTATTVAQRLRDPQQLGIVPH